MAADRSYGLPAVDDSFAGDKTSKSEPFINQVEYGEDPHQVKKFLANATAYLDSRGLLDSVRRKTPHGFAKWIELAASAEVNAMNMLDKQVAYLAHTTEHWVNSRKAFNILSQRKGVAKCKRISARCDEMRDFR